MVFRIQSADIHSGIGPVRSAALRLTGGGRLPMNKNFQVDLMHALFIVYCLFALYSSVVVFIRPGERGAIFQGLRIPVVVFIYFLGHFGWSIPRYSGQGSLWSGRYPFSSFCISSPRRIGRLAEYWRLTRSLMT